LKILIASGSKGKLFHLKEFGDALAKLGSEYKLVKDTEYSRGFPSKNIKDWFTSNKRFWKLIEEFKPDVIFADRQSHFALDAVRSKIPLFVLLRGHYWSEQNWAKKTLYKDPLMRTVLWFRNRIAEKCFKECTVILPICKYLENIVKEHYHDKPTSVFFEGIDASRWYQVKGLELKHPCVGLLQNANWWGKTKEMLILSKVLEAMPDVTFYWVEDGGPYRDKILSVLGKYDNFKWLGTLEYPDKVREFLSSIDVYALVSGMDLAPLTLKEAQLMERPVIATDVGGIPEMMKDKTTGFLVKEGDYNGWIEKLTLLIRDNKKANDMGKAGRQFVEKSFSWDLIASKFLDTASSYIKKN
jgi:glycosyltransferase involved in cell wall biosynthesis